MIYVLLEFIVGPRLSLFHWLHIPLPPTWLRIPVLLLIALLLVRFFAALKLSKIGLTQWYAWSRTEKVTFVLLFFITNLVFVAIFSTRMRTVLAEPSLRMNLWTVILPYVVWGFYQEVIYRGILQTELVRRWGLVVGILVSNTLFTFGPLHFYQFSHHSALAILAGIFATGLFFAVLFAWLRNLWLVGILHGIGNVYTDAIWSIR